MLQGQRLCIYLDPSREWHPSLGIGGGRAEDVAQGAERLWLRDCRAYGTVPPSHYAAEESTRSSIDLLAVLVAPASDFM